MISEVKILIIMRFLALLFILFFTNNITAQNKLNITSNIGVSDHLLIETKFNYPNPTNNESFVIPHYGRTYSFWDKKVAMSVGLAYETPQFKLFKRQHYFLVEGKLSYRNNFGFVPFYFLGIDAYLPRRVTKRKWRFNMGVRYAAVISGFDNTNEPPEGIAYYDLSTKAKNNWGLTYLLSYQLTDRLNIGLNFYHDLDGFAQVYLYNTFEDRIELFVQHMNYEVMLRVSYQLRDYSKKK